MKWNLAVVLIAVIFYCYKSNFFKKVDTVSYSVNLPDKLDGALKPNDKLDHTEHLFENVLHWPESFAVHAGDIYTGLGDGRIVRIIGDKMETITRIGKECAGQHEEHICGRPLGLEFSKDGTLYVVDAYYGLFAINIKTGQKKHLLSSTMVVDGHHLRFLNNLAIDDKENVIYLTQSSSRWDIGMVILSIFEHESSGRLLKYDMKTRQVSVLLSEMSFPNGITISHDGTALLIAEGNKHKIVKYYLQGPKKGLYADFTAVLPGEPDNLTKNKKGNYWVGLSNGRSKESPTLYDRFSEHPFLRRVFLYVHRLFTMPITSIMSVIPHKLINEIGFELKTGRILADLPLNHGMIIEIDNKGNIVQSLQSPSGKIAHISEVLEHNGYLYLGSWRNYYLGRLKL